VKAPGPALAAATAAFLTGCSGAEEVPADRRVLAGDAARGREIAAALGCGACHVIPGISGARGLVGPPLGGFGSRSFIAGIVPNRPAVLARFVRDAPAIAPETAMPALPLSEADARHVAAWLYTLR
jgi:mono/diheme cytochrome c family protein